MASLPPQRPQQRQPSPSSQNIVPNESPQRRGSQSPSAKSLDSQTLFLNNTDSSSVTQSERPQDQDQDQTHYRPSPNEEEGRKCWICFQDEADDGPDASPWRSPCPCALTAHEQCLLDWVADMEAPGPTRNTASTRIIHCPQCKSEIHLARPHSYILQAYSNMEKALGRLVVPGALSGLTYCLYIVCSHHGAYTIRMIFGPDDARRILTPAPHMSFLEHYLQIYAPALARPWFREWRGFRLELGLPLIPAALIASRTTLADAVLPILPIVFFATHPEHSHDITNGVWPPSAALTLVVLPYLRGLYDEYMDRVWAGKERAWVDEVRPRLGRDDENAEPVDENQRGQGRDDDDANNVVELEVDIEIGDTDDEGESDNEEPRNGIDELRVNVPADAPPPFGRNDAVRAPGLHVPPDDHNRNVDQQRREEDQAQRAAAQRVGEQVQQALRQEVQAAEGNGNQRRPRRNRGLRHNADWVVSTGRLAETVLGALAFPSVCAVAGEALRALLPTSWTIAPSRAGARVVPTGLLQTRWGRSIVGGCLFVVLKDALRIYCRWKTALSYRKRRVQDYDKATGKIVDQA